MELFLLFMGVCLGVVLGWFACVWFSNPEEEFSRKDKADEVVSFLVVEAKMPPVIAQSAADYFKAVGVI